MRTCLQKFAQSIQEYNATLTKNQVGIMQEYAQPFSNQA